MTKFYHKILEELRAMIPPTLFFFIALHLVTFLRVLMLKGSGMDLGATTSVTVASLVLGKAVLIADMLPFINRFPEKPLVYNVIWKTAIYFLIAMLFHYLENLIDHWREASGLLAANAQLLEEIVWPHFWAIQIFLFVLILTYCAARELVRVIGAEVLSRMFFGPIDKVRPEHLPRA